jgi:hypothetical protein
MAPRTRPDLSLRDLAAIIATDAATEQCERCGAVADVETLDGVLLCEGCVQE